MDERCAIKSRLGGQNIYYEEQLRWIKMHTIKSSLRGQKIYTIKWSSGGQNMHYKNSLGGLYIP